MKRRPILTPEEAIHNFIETWCLTCEMRDLMTDPSIQLTDIKPLCPEPTLDTCPIYKKIQLHRSVIKKEAPPDADIQD